jgi:membrane protein DedA with SNARE-associated domain
MNEWLIQMFSSHQYLIYAIIIAVSFVEGPVLAVFCGMLLHLDSISFLPIYIALMAGDTIGDIIWYTVGYHFGRKFVVRFGKYFSITENSIKIVEKIFHNHKNYILIISKITMGFGFAIVTLVTAGITKIPFKQYLVLNIVGQFVWTATLLAIGYGFGSIYEQLDGVLGIISIVTMGIIFMVALFGYGKYVKQRMLSKNA